MIDKLYNTHSLDKDELIALIRENINGIDNRLLEAASSIREVYYDKKVFFRGLIEFSNYCKNDCYYCGIRRSNSNAQRYRLKKGDILDCCASGYELGFRTFVLQSGEDLYYTDNIMVDLIDSIKSKYPDCAITLSMGEKSYSSYKKYFQAGADRYLLRHETATEDHYRRLHPDNMSLSNRKKSLYNLKEIGFQVGAGFMVGSPYQTIENLANDLLFLKELEPHMVGIGPFIPHSDTIFADENAGALDMTVLMIAIVRLLLPKALLPATTALGTIDSLGREKGLKAGANVVMPNLSPISVRKDYSLYDNKICTGDEAAECRYCIEERIKAAGFQPDFSRGDYIGMNIQS
ncbi:biotin synthase [Proteiniborus ethanoligenes]|uniref:Biotin synthase n=1 Tax=Proteiniborus ethanoligenes TaxID=415015 RepID=A0A1H3NTL4_9FIRM|nr:[FeFe] hydrogenase H-cluster radical SAM maturase HydE [Proteiniborus ethanoligenes]SDY92164.1 biotin synthase [Proteiniborus ethanoligenes]